jgi:formate/nitrite transporter FocA (FNT family)
MTPDRERRYRLLFLTAAVYDLTLGAIFTLFYRQAFDVLGVEDELPDGGYVPLIGAFLFVIGFAYVLIWRGDLWRNRDLIAVGTLYKAAYAAIALWMIIIDEVPHWSFAAFGAIDVVFFALMLECWLYLRRVHTTALPATPPDTA